MRVVLSTNNEAWGISDSYKLRHRGEQIAIGVRDRLRESELWRGKVVLDNIESPCKCEGIPPELSLEILRFVDTEGAFQTDVDDFEGVQ